jgi:hypothetical protein
MAHSTKDLVGVTVMAHKDVRKQARKILIDEGISMAQWINSVLQDLIEKHTQLHAQHTYTPQTKYLKHDLMDK